MVQIKTIIKQGISGEKRICKALYSVITITIPMPAATRLDMGRAHKRIPTKAPKKTPVIWVRQDSIDALKVGCTAAMAPSIAKISFDEVVPYRFTIAIDTMTAIAVLIVRKPIWIR